MTRVGLVGGLGPESTIDYYRRLLAEFERQRPGSSPSIVIDSLDVQIGLKLAGSDRAGLTEYLLQSIRRLAGAGVDFIAITANTGHLVFDELSAQSPVRLLSIVETCADEAQVQRLRRLALLGTRFTMEAPFYPTVFGRRGIAIVPPNPAERAWIHERYVGQLLKGDFRDETRNGMLDIIARLRDEEHVDGVIYGGTELPLLLTGETAAGLPTLETTALHVAAIVRHLVGSSPGGKMRKHVVGPISVENSIPRSNWVDVDKDAKVEVSSEDAEHPVEAALRAENGTGWRAAEGGAQTIRLLFDAPRHLHRLWLVFEEHEVPRTQEVVIRWSPDGGKTYQDVVRQQYTFSPPGTTREVEDYSVKLSGVTAVELKIVPDISGGPARASLSEWLMA
jgi:aspartate racemase